MKENLVSIVIPIYNVEAYLENCINSLIEQTYKNIEIILVDDGSPDKCPKICDDFSKKDKRIKVIHKPNGGLSDARNSGIAAASGEYITFVDSDDTVDNDYVEYLYSIMEEFKSDISICDYKAIYSNGTILSRNRNDKFCISKEKTLEIMLYQNEFTVSSWAKMYKTKLFRENNIIFPVGKIFEDAYTTYKLVELCENVGVGMESKYNYMIRNNSILTSIFSEKKLMLVDAYNEMTSFIKKKYPNLKSACIRANVYSRISTLRQMIYSKPRLKKLEKEYIGFIKDNGCEVLKDKNSAKRDKFAIILIMLNINLFKICWKIYCKATGRNI